VAWAAICVTQMIVTFAIWRIARFFWRRGFKRAAYMGGAFSILAIGYLALNLVSPFVCDHAIDSALKRMPPPGERVVFAKRGANYERLILPLDRRINADEVSRSAVLIAVLSIEDKRFPGRWAGPVDPISLLRAAVQTFFLKNRQGGSTILVQAAKLIQGKNRSSLGDKPYQFLMALRLYQRFPTDEEQLALYLSLAKVDGQHGIAYAASSFYGVANLSELKTTDPRGIAGSAMLAGMLKSPAEYHPRRDPNQALERRNLVLRKMHEAGVFEDLAAMRAMPLDVRASPVGAEFDFFARAVRRNNL
jgi:membrane peptidoglycan carboxypeptidase